jgi:ADP-heptose:LPS heptosyltransferase
MAAEKEDYEWINPVGGLGDMLMVAGVLKQVVEREPERRFNLIRRTRYSEIFQGHEAIAAIGTAPAGARLRHTTYWSMEKLGGGEQRPYQVLARHFGLSTPAPEVLYLPGSQTTDDPLADFLPWKSLNVAIAPASDSPRKTVVPQVWHQLVEGLTGAGAFVFQVGLGSELRIRNAYGVMGLTTPHQLFALLRMCDLVVTVDNFIMHAAHCVGVPAVVMWGPTRHEVYGYPEQIHLQAEVRCGYPSGSSCIDSEENRSGALYGTECQHGARRCMNEFSAEDIYTACRRQLG